MHMVWVFDPHEKRVVEKLEVHLALARRQLGFTYRHNDQEFVAGSRVRDSWITMIRTAAVVCILHSPHFYADDRMISLWETLISPEARAAGVPVVPIIAAPTDPRTLKALYKEVEVPLPLGGSPLKGDVSYAEVASELHILLQRRQPSPIVPQSERDPACLAFFGLNRNASESDLIRAYRQKVRSSADGQGGYTGDMDMVGRQRDAALLFLREMKGEQ